MFRPHYYHVICFDLINLKHKEMWDRCLTEEEEQECMACVNNAKLEKELVIERQLEE